LDEESGKGEDDDQDEQSGCLASESKQAVKDLGRSVAEPMKWLR
jgi:hypothetical protein